MEVKFYHENFKKEGVIIQTHVTLKEKKTKVEGEIVTELEKIIHREKQRYRKRDNRLQRLGHREENKKRKRKSNIGEQRREKGLNSSYKPENLRNGKKFH